MGTDVEDGIIVGGDDIVIGDIVIEGSPFDSVFEPSAKQNHAY